MRVFSTKWILLVWAVAAGLVVAVSVLASEPIGAQDEGLYRRDQAVSTRLRVALSERFPGARVEILGSPRWTEPFAAQDSAMAADGPRGIVRDATLIDEDGLGNARFSAQIDTGEGPIVSTGSVSFAAFLPARVATRRILPGEPLLPGAFTVQDVNVASGQGREYRGLIYPASVAVQGLEARQTIVEGQFLVSSAIEKIPDVRRGDSVQIHLVSGGLTLTAAGVAEEPAYVDGRVRVMSSSTKRELVGKLLNGGVVEVRL